MVCVSFQACAFMDVGLSIYIFVKLLFFCLSECINILTCKCIYLNLLHPKLIFLNNFSVLVVKYVQSHELAYKS